MANEFKLSYTADEIDEKLGKVIDGALLPAVTGLDNGKVLTVVNGKWTTSTSIGGNSNIDFKVVNESGWLTKTVSYGSDCVINLSWTSIEDGLSTGDGTLRVTSNGAVKTTKDVEQGSVEVEIGKFLSIGSNDIEVIISDVYGNSRTIKYTITAVAISISSYFDDTIAYVGGIQYNYTPVGAIDKTVHFLIDGEEIGTQIVTVSNREQSYTIPAQAHGSHTLEVYFVGSIDDQTVESNHLHYDLICYEDGDPTPIIASSFNVESVKQYSTVVIPYIVYTPNALTSAIQLKDGDTVVSNLTVDRTRQTWAYKASEFGTKNLSIVCGDTVKPISFEVMESEIDVTAETSNLELYLSSEGRSNNEDNPLVWSYGDISAEMTGFNLKSDGWQSDSDGNTVLRVSGDARVNIPFNIFASDFRTTGKTIEIELATREVINYDAVVLSSWAGDRGIKVTAQKATMKSEQSEIFTQYKEDEHIRVTFCVEKRAENRLLAIYINGIMSGVVQYPDDDDFSQSTPVGISIGSNDCTVDIYCIRVYGNNLSRYQIVDNWIADTQNVDTMIDRYTRNNVFDDYGNISIAKLPKYIPYLVINAATYNDLPQSKGDKKTVSGAYIDPLHQERGFTFEGAEIDVQGTSSQYYARKNYKIKFKGGFVVNGVAQETYQLRETSMPTDVFTFKADVASSEGANNVELVMLYDDTCPVKTPPQESDSRVRQGIEGYPCLAFYYDGTDYNFLGKYNFNNDKSTEEVFGFAAGDESWEILQNNTEMVIWKDDNFDGTAWKTSFEGRYPDENTDTTNLAAFSTWLKSTDTTAVNTEEEKAERLAKFKTEFADWCNVDAMLFNYIFTELFLMVDNRAKNAFPTRYDEDGKWLILPYDYDTAIGINNEGELKFGYELEDTDLVNGNNVFNGQDSVLYVNMRLAYADEIMAMYQDLRTNDILSYDEVESRFENHQGVWGESIFNEDARFKYITPLINDGNKTYLPMLQGSKAEQRKWWLYNRFRYMDSKYNAGDSLEDYIMLRSYAVADITVTPYADIYAAAKFDSALVKERALRGGSYTLVNPLSGGRDAVVSIYSASQLSSVGDLSGLKAGMADFSKATKLSSLKVGSGESGYDNPNLTDLTIGNLTLLKELDVRNCSALAQTVDISGCGNIERVYFDGTAITGVKLPVGGILKTLHLPSTVTSLVIQNHSQLTDFVMPSYENITTLRLEYISQDSVDAPAILSAMPDNSRVRLIGIDWTVESVDDIYALYDKLDTCRGLDENGGNLDKAVVSGKIYVDMVSETDLARLTERYPDVRIEYDRIGCLVQFIDDDTVLFRELVEVGGRITIPANPTKEATAQYTYVFGGWSYDGVDIIVPPSTATGDNLIFYPVYTAILRSYTITFMNGTNSLQSTTLYYGEIPVYEGMTPIYTEADGAYSFTGWSPEIAPVTGEATYTAQFVQRKALSEYSWEEISAISADGTAANYFNVGEAKGIIVSGTVGTLEINSVLYVYILGFDHNSELEGTGITFGTFTSAEYNGSGLCLVDSQYIEQIKDGTKNFNMNHWGTYNYGGWAGCDMRYDILGSTDVAPSDYGAAKTTSVVGYDATETCATNPVPNTLMAALPADLRAVMKPMTKYTDGKGNRSNSASNVIATIDYLPLLAEFEIFGERNYANTYEQSKQKQYDYYVAGKSKKKYGHSTTDSFACWWGRSAGYQYSNNFCCVLAPPLSSTAGIASIQGAYRVLGLAPIFKV